MYEVNVIFHIHVCVCVCVCDAVLQFFFIFFLCSHPLSYCLNNVEHVPSHLLLQLEQEYWVLTDKTLQSLRSSLWEASHALQHVKGASISHFTVSRFIMLYAGMLTTMQIPASLSFLVNNGALSLSQTMLRLSNPSTLEEEVNDAVVKEVVAASETADGDSKQGESATAVTVATPTLPQESLSGPALVRRIAVGVRVIRGPDWKWGDQVCKIQYKITL